MTRYLVRYAVRFAWAHKWFRLVLLAAFIAAVITGHFHAAHQRMDGAVAVQDRVWLNLSTEAVAWAKAQH